MNKLVKYLPKIKAYRSKDFGSRLYQHSFKKYSPSAHQMMKFSNIILNDSVTLAALNVSELTEDLVHDTDIIDAWRLRHAHNSLESTICRMMYYDDCPQSFSRTKDKIIDSFADEMAEEIVDFIDKVIK